MRRSLYNNISLARLAAFCGTFVLVIDSSNVSLAGNTTYVYDELGRLTTVAAPTNTSCFVYDDAGNRTSETVTPVSQSAVNDSITTSKNTPITYDPRTNDAGNCVTLTVTAVGTPAHGTAAIVNAGQAITYTPATDYTGTDSFTYTITSSLGAQDAATETVTVTP